jgi:hypothetical protein
LGVRCQVLVGELASNDWWLAFVVLDHWHRIVDLLLDDCQCFDRTLLQIDKT